MANLNKMSSSSNPRKFAEKIANLKRKEADEANKFNEIMNEVHSLHNAASKQSQSASTKNTNGNADHQNVSGNQPINNSACHDMPGTSFAPGLTVPVSHCRGGSLPNVHEMVLPPHMRMPMTIQTGQLPADLAADYWLAAAQAAQYNTGQWVGAAPMVPGQGVYMDGGRAIHQTAHRGRSPGGGHYHPYSPRGGSPTGNYRPNSRERGVVGGGGPLIGQYVYNPHATQQQTQFMLQQHNNRSGSPSQYLQLPDNSNWRRTHSDPGIHASIQQTAHQRTPLHFTRSTDPVPAHSQRQQSPQEHTPATTRSSNGSNDSPSLTDMSSPPTQAQNHVDRQQRASLQLEGNVNDDPMNCMSAGSLPNLPESQLQPINYAQKQAEQQQPMPGNVQRGSSVGITSSTLNEDGNTLMQAHQQQRHSIQLPLMPDALRQQTAYMQAALMQNNQSATPAAPGKDPNIPWTQQLQNMQKSGGAAGQNFEHLNNQFQNITVSAADWALLGQQQHSLYQQQIKAQLAGDPREIRQQSASPASSAGQIVPNIILTDAHGMVNPSQPADHATSNEQTAQQQSQWPLDCFQDVLGTNLDGDELQRLLAQSDIDVDEQQLQQE